MSTVLSRPRRADVRAGILQAAAQVFLEHGYADSTLADIAAAAGYTKGAVYSNFDGKPDLFSTVFAERSALVTGLALAGSGLLQPLEEGADAASAVAAVLTEQLTDGSPWPTALAEFRVLAVRDPAVAAAYERLRIQQRERLEDQLREAAGPLGLPADFDYPMAATLLLTTANALAGEHAAAPQATSRALVESVLTHLVRSLLP